LLTKILPAYRHQFIALYEKIAEQVNVNQENR